MVGKGPEATYSRRERQVMDALYQLGEAGAAEVVALLRESGAHDSVRVILANLERKGVLGHRVDGQRHIYKPVTPRETARRTALRHLVRTHYEGSPKRVILHLLDDARLDGDDLEVLSRAIDLARRERQAGETRGT
jgi:predicted transcriptional regulator